MTLRSLAVRDPAFPSFNPPHQVPLVAASSFVFESIEQGNAIFDGEQPGHIYGRFGNPTVEAAARKIAEMEAYGTDAHEVQGLFCSSGMAAIATVLMGICNAGDSILTAPDLYGGTVNLIEQLERKGIRKITTDLRDSEKLEDVLAEEGGKVCIIYAETPSNPTLRCTDLSYLADLAHHYDALLVVDNTFATPICQQPLDCGADIVVHSTTKYLNGHGTGVAGAVVCRDPEIFHEKLVPTYRLYGGSGNPWDAWLVLNGLKTLDLRMKAHSENATRVADFLRLCPRVTAVNHPSRPHPEDTECAKRQLKLCGGMLSFELDGGLEAARRFMNSIEFITLTPTLGDVDTLILHPATMSHRGLEAGVRQAHGISDGLLRLSVGIEDPDDIIADLQQAIG